MDRTYSVTVKIAGLVLVLAGLLLLAPACYIVGQKSVRPTVKIGLVAPFEGLHRPLGYEALFAVKLALQERNRADGLGGYRVELVALNDFDRPAAARAQAAALIADPDVVGVVGHLSSAPTLAAWPIYQEAALAVSVPWTVAEPELAAGAAGIVRVAASEAETAARLERIRRELGFHNVLTLTEAGVTDIPDPVQALQISTDGVAAGELVLNLRRAGIDLPLLGQVDVGTPQLPQVAGQAADGLIYVSPGPDPRRISGGDAFVTAYQALAGFPPGPRAALAYDATNVLLDSIEQVAAGNKGRPARPAVSAAITGVQRRGVSGDIAFDALGRRLDAPIWTYQIAEAEYPGAAFAP